MRIASPQRRISLKKLLRAENAPHTFSCRGEVCQPRGVQQEVVPLASAPADVGPSPFPPATASTESSMAVPRTSPAELSSNRTLRHEPRSAHSARGALAASERHHTARPGEHVSSLSQRLRVFVAVAALALGTSRSASAGVNASLEQVRNGTATATSTPTPTWVSGNAGASNSHYLESHSIPYRAVMTGLPTNGTVIEITLDYAIKRSNSYAIDYLTQYQRL